MKKEIVSTYLVEDLLRKWDCWRLVFHYHPRTKMIVVEHAVGTHRLVADTKLHLVGEQSGGIALVLCQEMNEMLADPFLWSKGYEFPAENIEDLLAPVHTSDTYFIRWKVQSLHFLFVSFCFIVFLL